ncbi:MAG: alpha/beta hydrolase, partial [Acidobacteria bacterium]|nr:alpha/beta hydrolase [Acidobacteriota bacterium]
ECPQVVEIPMEAVRTAETYLQIYRESSRACAAYWQGRGVDLGAYHTEASADDIDALRAALGVEQVMLVGGSYGSHLVFSTIRRHGDRVQRALVPGTEGPDHTLKLPSNVQKQLEKIGKAVAADPALGVLVPDFVGLVRSVLGRLEKEPVTSEVGDARTGQKVKVTLSKFDLQLVTAQGLGSSAFIRQLPAAYYDMSHGDFSWLAQGILNRRRQPLSAMSSQVDCASGISEERAARIRREASETLLGDVIDFPGLAVCDAWVKHDLGPGFRGPLVSSVPALFISGTLDGRTPPSNVDEIRAGFPNSHHVVVEYGTHSAKETIFTLPETKEAAVTFLKGGTVTLTAAALPPLEFAKPKTAPATRVSKGR